MSDTYTVVLTNGDVEEVNADYISVGDSGVLCFYTHEVKEVGDWYESALILAYAAGSWKMVAK